MDAAGEVCFDLQKPLIGGPPGRVCLTQFGELRVEHRLLKAPVVFSADRLHAVIEAGSSEPDDLPPLVREPVAVHLPRDAFTPANVALVLREPVRVGPFKFGAQQLIPLRRSQRRQGLDVDVLSMTVAEPALLVQGLRGLGVASPREAGRALEGVIARVPPELEAQVHETRRRRERRAAWKVMGIGLATAALLGARAVGDSAWETVGRAALASAAAAVLVGLALSLWPTRPPGSSSARRWGAWSAAGLLGVAAFGAALGASDRLSGGSYLLMWSLLAGAISGVVVAGGVRGLARARSSRDGDGPLARPPRKRWVTAGPVGLLSVAVMAAAVASEESAARIIRDVQAALVDEEDIPGWTECCDSDGIFRGDSLDQHICGGDDDALAAHRAAVRRSFNILTAGRPDLADAHFDLTVLVAPTVADAQQEFAAVDSPGYVECTSTAIGKVARSFQWEATDRADVLYDGREHIEALPDLVVDRFYIQVPVSGGVDVMTGYFVRARVGRAIVRMPILVYVPESVSSSERDALVRTVIDRVTVADL